MTQVVTPQLQSQLQSKLRWHWQSLMPLVSNELYPNNPSMYDEILRLFNFARDASNYSWPEAEDVMEEFRHNGKDYEYCPESESGVPVNCNRRKKNRKPIPTECVFCKNNGEDPTYYRKHILKAADGRVRCPVLRAYVCPICGVSGDNAHTIKYCPANKNPEPIPVINTLKVLRNSSGKRRSK